MIVKFNELYKDDIINQEKRFNYITEKFNEFFKCSVSPEFFSAPGRTEVGGNHTDHQRGAVVTASINLDIVAAAFKREDGIIVLKSDEYTKYDEIDTKDLEIKEKEIERSASLIRGICKGLVDRGYKVGGFNAYTISSVLKGSGLSSSAAFEVLVVTILNHFYNEGKIDPVTVAQIAQFAENVYFGKPSGLLDQMASSVGGFSAIDFENKAEPKIEKIDFDPAKYGYDLCVVDTGGSHADLTFEYAAIPGEMKKIAAHYGKEVLREVDEEKFMADLKELRALYGDRAVLRAMHFFSDNKLAKLEAEALKAEDFETFKSYVIKSGKSSLQRLQNVFSVVNPQEQGLTLALSISEQILENKGAWRIHGGGFAGTIQAYVPKSLTKEYKAAIEAVFGEGTCHILSVRSAGGTKIEK